MTSERLASVLGEVFWSAEVPDMATANRQAARRMASGRPAVSWSEGGRCFVAWGVAA